MINIPNYNGPKRFIQKRIAAGHQAAVYRLSDDLAVKFMTEGLGPFRRILNDDAVIHELNAGCEVAEELYNRGISVPKPFGVFRVQVRITSLRYMQSIYDPRRFPGMIMEYIDGVFIEKAPKEKRKHLIELAELEVSKAIIAGLRDLNKDYNLNKNVLCVLGKGNEPDKVYLTGLNYLLSDAFRK